MNYYAKLKELENDNTTEGIYERMCLLDHSRDLWLELFDVAEQIRERPTHAQIPWYARLESVLAKLRGENEPSR